MNPHERECVFKEGIDLFPAFSKIRRIRGTEKDNTRSGRFVPSRLRGRFFFRETVWFGDADVCPKMKKWG